jgi:hypothetical protein
MKMLVNSSIQDPYLQLMLESKTCPLVDVVPVKKGKYVDGSFFFTFVYSVFLLSLLLISGVWLATATTNGGVYEFKGMVHLVSSFVSVMIMVVIIQVLIIQAGRMDDSGKVRRNHSLHFLMIYTFEGPKFLRWGGVIQENLKCSK